MKTKNNLSFLNGGNAIVSDGLIERSKSHALAALLLLLLLPMISSSVLAQSSNAQVQTSEQNRIITYQAQIIQNGTPVPDGLYHITASLYSDADGRMLMWRSEYATEVRGGIANLNLGETRKGGTPLPEVGLDGQLYLGVRIGSKGGQQESGSEEMRPLTQLTSSLNALSVADNAITKEKIAANYVEQIVINGDTLNGKATTLNLTAGQGIELFKDDQDKITIVAKPNATSNPNSTTYWSEDGNVAVASTDYLGTSDGNSLNIRVAALRAMLYEPNPTSVNILGGHHSNTKGSSVVGTVIAGGGDTTTPNSVTGDYAVISGGKGNLANNVSVVGGGEDNQANGQHAVVGGGENNKSNYYHTTVGGGYANEITTSTSTGSTIAGGRTNKIAGTDGAIGGGIYNELTSTSEYSTISGGTSNTIVGDYSAIAGGQLLKLGDKSFGYNAYGNLVDLSATSNVAYFGDVDVMIGNKGNAAKTLRFYEASGNGSSYTSFKAPASLIADVAYILPSAQGAATTVLTNDGSGNLSWGAGPAQSWSLTGNTGTSPGTNYIGTSDNTGFQIHVDNSGTATQGRRRVAGFFPSTLSPNIVLGFNGNFWTGSLSGVTISGGGQNNAAHEVTGNYGTIGGGSGNTAAIYSTVGGGGNNKAIGNRSAIGGGVDNIASGDYSTIAGGWMDSAISTLATVGGGTLNTAKGYATTVGGGDGNKAERDYSFIGSGRLNENYGMYGTIGGGWINKIGDFPGDDPEEDYQGATIGGGVGNLIEAHNATIAGGHEVHAIGLASFVGGGGTRTHDHVWPDYSNRAKGEYSIVVGGSSNEADGNYSFVGGGGFDPAYPVVRQDGNRALTDYSIIVGGKANTVREVTLLDGTGKFGSILGGHNLVAQSHGQTVMGYWNKLQGNRTSATKTHNDRLLIVGNGTGDVSLRSNAFEVSANGHSIVYHSNGTGGATGAGNPLPGPIDLSKGAIIGATYQDNIIYAWANVTPLTTGTNVNVTSDFATARVIHAVAGSGLFDVTISTVHQYNSPETALDLANASIVATITGEDPCAFISTTVTGLNTFRVTIKDRNCSPVDKPFTFHVTGRP